MSCPVHTIVQWVHTTLRQIDSSLLSSNNLVYGTFRFNLTLPQTKHLQTCEILNTQVLAETHSFILKGKYTEVYIFDCPFCSTSLQEARMSKRDRGQIHYMGLYCTSVPPQRSSISSRLHISSSGVTLP